MLIKRKNGSSQEENDIGKAFENDCEKLTRPNNCVRNRDSFVPESSSIFDFAVLCDKPYDDPCFLSLPQQ